MNVKEIFSTIKGLIFLSYTIKEGSISKAAIKTGVKQPYISSELRALEGYLGTKLFTRTSKGIIPTDAGQTIFQHTSKIIGIFNNLRSYSLDSAQVSGKIRLWTTDGMGSCCLAEHLTEFCCKYPKTSLEITCSNDMPNIAGREADVAILYHEPTHSDSVVISKHNICFSLFASPEYIAQYGFPKSMKDLLENHRICDRKEYRSEWKEWDKMITKAQNVVAISDSTTMLMQLSKLGIGITLHPKSAGLSDKDLVHIDLGFELNHPYWLVSHIDAKDSPRVRLLLEHINSIIKKI